MNEANIDRVPHGVLIKIRALYDTLKSAERRLVDYLLENPVDVQDSTIVEMAGRAGCSEATIVRLSKKLGFEGFPELKAAFGSEDGQSRKFEYEGIVAGDNCVTVMKKVFDATRDALNDTFDLLMPEDHERAVDALLGASRIVFAGLGAASASGQRQMLREPLRERSRTPEVCRIRTPPVETTKEFQELVVIEAGAPELTDNVVAFRTEFLPKRLVVLAGIVRKHIRARKARGHAASREEKGLRMRGGRQSVCECEESGVVRPVKNA